MIDESVKNFDIVIYGASGFTGRYVIEELCHSVKLYNVKWAIAGRNVNKLKESLKIVQKYLGHEFDIQNTPIIYADAQDAASLDDMCKQTRLLLNCVGPYNFYGGELVVKICIDNGTHCIDISAEMKYLENIQVKYFQTAREKKVYIVEACGFGSLPADYGISVLQQNFPGDLNSVEYFVGVIEGPKGRSLHVGTLLSLIHSIKDMLQFRKYDINLKSVFKQTLPPYTDPLRVWWIFPFYSRKVRSLCAYYIGPDARIMKRSQMMRYEYLNEKPIQSAGFFEAQSFRKGALLYLVFITCILLALFKKGLVLLAKYPSIFTGGQVSKNGPTREQVLEGTTKFTFFGTGWKAGTDKNSKQNSKMRMTITGPEAAYPFTATCMVQAGLTVLLETDKLPLEGGVFTPGVAFDKTQLRERLEKRGIKFEIQDDE